MKAPDMSDKAPLRLLSVVIPARDEVRCIGSTVEHLHLELGMNRVPHEIVVVDDGSSDRTIEAAERAEVARRRQRPVLAQHQDDARIGSRYHHVQFAVAIEVSEGEALSALTYRGVGGRFQSAIAVAQQDGQGSCGISDDYVWLAIAIQVANGYGLRTR